MALMLSKLYDAPLEAGASDLKAREAAEEAAAYEQRFATIERQFEEVKGEQRLQRWMLSVALVLLLGVFWRVFTIPPAGPPAAPPAGELRKHLDHLLVWFLAWVYAPAMRDDHPHWYVRVESLRCEIETIVDVWPHLTQRVATALPKAYVRGREVASEETGLPLETFPQTCPWAPEQVIRHGFWAGERA